jgi:transcriptional regulator, XRE family
MKINEKIRQLRLENKMSQKELSQKLGISLSMLQKYEYGDYKINNDVLLKLLDIFKLSISDFKDYIDKETENDLKITSEINTILENRPFISYDMFIKLLMSLNFEVLDFVERTDLTYYDKISDTPIITIKNKEEIVALDYNQFINLKLLVGASSRSIIENFLSFIFTEGGKSKFSDTEKEASANEEDSE